MPLSFIPRIPPSSFPRSHLALDLITILTQGLWWYDEDVWKCHRIYKTAHNMVLKIRYATVGTIPLDLCVAKTNKNHHWGFIFVMRGFQNFLKQENMVGYWADHFHPPSFIPNRFQDISIVKTSQCYIIWGIPPKYPSEQHTLGIDNWKLLVIALTEYMTFHGPDTPTEWTSESIIYGPTDKGGP